MTPFDIVKNIVSEKNPDKYTKEDLSEVFKSNYFFQRWLSMFDLQSCFIMSKTTNLLHRGIDTPEEMSKVLISILPKKKYHRFQFIKRNYKTIDENTQRVIEYLSDKLEISKKEIVNNSEFFDIDLNQYNTLLNIKG